MPASPLHSPIRYQDGISRCHFCAKLTASSAPLEQCEGALPLRTALLQIAGIARKEAEAGGGDGVALNRIAMLARETLGMSPAQVHRELTNS